MKKLLIIFILIISIAVQLKAQTIDTTTVYAPIEIAGRTQYWKATYIEKQADTTNIKKIPYVVLVDTAKGYTYELSSHLNVDTLTMTLQVRMNVSYKNSHGVPVSFNLAPNGTNTSAISKVGDNIFPTVEFAVYPGCVMTITVMAASGVGKLSFNPGARWRIDN